MTPDAPEPVRGEAVPVILALGSNLGDRLRNLDTGLRVLGRRIRVERVSRVVESEPWGPVPQGPFLNLVLRGTTELEPMELLEVLQAAEREAGRGPGLRFGPRTLDIDLIFYGDRTSDDPRLAIPHPRWEERPFVYALLPDVAGGMVDPASGRALSSLLPGGRLPEGLSEVAPIGWPSDPAGPAPTGPPGWGSARHEPSAPVGGSA